MENSKDEEIRWNNGKPNTRVDCSRYYDHLDERRNYVQKLKQLRFKLADPTNILKGLRALEFTDGIVTTVSDSEMLDGMSVVGLNGFDCEMASGASVVGIKKLIDEENN